MKRETQIALTLKTTSREHARNILTQLHRADNPGPLVRSLTPHDFLTAFRMADDEQRADLLIIADKEQVELLFDLACWQGDKPDLAELSEVIRPTVESGLGGATRMLYTLPDELRTLVLKQHAVIHLLEDRNEVLQVPETSELIPCSDGYYFIEFPAPELVTDVERALFQALLLRPFEEYQRELESLRHEFPSNLEEDAYRWRASRLADFGFPTREEAIAILSPRSPEEVRHLADKATNPLHPLAGSLILPVLYREHLQGNEFVDEVLRTLLEEDSPETAERIDSLGVEFTAASNRFLAARGLDIGDPDAVARGITEVRNLFALGLISVSRGDIHDARRLLHWVDFAHFIQVGVGLTAPLRTRAQKVLRQLQFAPGARKGETLDPPHYVALTGLDRIVPGFWPPLIDPEESQGLSPELIMPRDEHIRTFASEQEIEKLAVFLEEVEALPHLLFDQLELTRPLPAETPASILLLTCLGNMNSDRGKGCWPLTPEAAQACFKKYYNEDKQRFLGKALETLAPAVQISLEGTTDPAGEPHRNRRLLLRLLHIGHARLKTGMLEQSFVII